ncbi:MAG TPA: ABC transporter substrate-binding protein [Limnochordia bacterium]|jgi:ribose transport system substrate-binding protein|nr:ABC transporter substrate-binding protein [Bacillota bacterium]HOK32731.1 ABC transporter substrate-binding protein [Limnochordia bacterium]
MRKFKVFVVLTLVALLLVAPAVSAKNPPYTVALSNGFVGSEWRIQMVEAAQVVFDEYKEKGLVTGELYVNHAGPDVTAQIAAIRNMINRGFDVIIINPNSQTALNPVIEEAVEQGIIVIVVDQEVTAPNAINVVIDQAQWARFSAQWLANQLGGEGNVVVLNGLAGHPASEDRFRGVQDVFGQYPGINVLTVAYADWDQATGQQVMSNLLATYPSIDGVWSQDGSCEGALRAVLAAGGEMPIMVGEARVGFMRQWAELKEKTGFSSIGVANPPGVAASGLRIAMNLLQGKEFKDGILARGNTLYVPIPVIVTNDNFDAIWEQYKDLPDAYSIDGWLSEEEALAFFK